MRQHNVFIYGTLMTGRHNNDRMLYLGADPIEPDAFVNSFELFDVIGAEFPAAIPGHGTIHGELWRMDSIALRVLDRFEACYVRTRTDVYCEKLDRLLRTWIYIWKFDHSRLGFQVPDGTRWQGSKDAVPRVEVADSMWRLAALDGFSPTLQREDE